jgi:hypothetical protein
MLFLGPISIYDKKASIPPSRHTQPHFAWSIDSVIFTKLINKVKPGRPMHMAACPGQCFSVPGSANPIGSQPRVRGPSASPRRLALWPLWLSVLIFRQARINAKKIDCPLDYRAMVRFHDPVRDRLTGAMHIDLTLVHSGSAPVHSDLGGAARSSRFGNGR